MVLKYLHQDGFRSRCFDFVEELVMFSNICGELQLWFNGEKEKSVLAAVLGNDEVYSVGAGV